MDTLDAVVLNHIDEGMLRFFILFGTENPKTWSSVGS